MSTVASYQRKTKKVRAMQYDGQVEPAKDFTGIKDAQYDEGTRAFIIPNNDGETVAQTGDYIVERDGEFIAMDAAKFEEEYELDAE